MIILNARVLTPESEPQMISVLDGRIEAIGRYLPIHAGDLVVDACGAVALPGLVDVHVHFREPGYEYKETMATGGRAAAAGGFTTVMPMPNVNPVPDSVENMELSLKAAADSPVETIPYASITKGRKGRELLDDYESLAGMACAFSDDGSGVADYDVQRRAMERIAATGKILAAHCEVASLLDGGYIHKGEYAAAHGHKGICSESEWLEVEENIRLAEATGCRLHICHVSTKESVAAIRAAKARGVDVTAETGAHYLAFCDADLQEDGRFKMNPPLRSAADRDALIEGVADGTIDMIASDHAPHSAEEKSRGLAKSAMGVTGLELSLPAVYTYMVRTGRISFKKMVELMADAPRRRFGIEGGLKPGDRADIAIVDFDKAFKVDPAAFLSKGKSTPFAGLELYGRVKMTICAGKPVYINPMSTVSKIDGI